MSEELPNKPDNLINPSNSANKPQYEDPLDSIDSKPDFAQIARDAGYRNPEEEITTATMDTIKKQAKSLLNRLQHIFASKPDASAEQLEKLENLGLTLHDSQPQSKAETAHTHAESKNILRRIDAYMLNSNDLALVERWKEQKRFGKLYITFLVTMLGVSYAGAVVYDWLTPDKNTASPPTASAQEIPGQASWEQPVVLPTPAGESVKVNFLDTTQEIPSVKPLTPAEFEAAGFLLRVIQPGDTLMGYADLLGVEDQNKAAFVTWITALNGIANPDAIEAFSEIYLPPSSDQIPVGR